MNWLTWGRGVVRCGSAATASTSVWRGEKNRPHGSHLVRVCACSQGGPLLCVVHACEPLLACCALGQRLFQYTESQFLSAVRKSLILLGIQGAEACSLKAFRAGRATSLAKHHPIGTILAAGEWKSKAFLRYCHAEDLDITAVLEDLFEHDED